MIAELDLVALTRDLPESRLAAGDVGTVVHRHGHEGYEVEFVTGEGDTLAVVSLLPADVRLLEDNDILHARKI